MRSDFDFIRRNFTLRERITGEPRDGVATLLPIDHVSRRGPNWIVDGVIRMGLRRSIAAMRKQDRANRPDRRY